MIAIKWTRRTFKEIVDVSEEKEIELAELKDTLMSIKYGLFQKINLAA